MATFEQLSADQRAIVELILKRGQSYEELSEMLGMSEDRVRELAQTALVELAPSTAAAVDEDWRGQLADYILGQQSGPESTATRGHLRRSEGARAWARSLLDSLDDLYEGDDRPSIPEGDRSSARPERKPRRERVREPEDDDEDERPRGPLSPEARAAVRRRRLIGGALAILALLLIIAFVPPIKVVSRIKGEDEEPARRASSNQPRLVGQTVLRPIDGNKQGGGVAVVAERGNQRQLIVQAQLPPSARRTAYEVWLYNSDGNAQSIGAQVTDKQGRYQGAGPLPADFDKFKYIDISREPIDRNAKHSGQSILRGATAPLKGGAQPQQPQPQPQQAP